MKINKKIKENLKIFEGLKKRDHRFASYDYCYNYFFEFRKEPKELFDPKYIEKSCLYLMSYLASWGMYRGSTFLLQKTSLEFFKKLIEIIAEHKELWEIDVDKYSDENIEKIDEFYKKVQEGWSVGDKKPTTTLITKILMGVYGCTPAFDDNVTKAMNHLGYGKGRYGKKLKGILTEIKRFYRDNQAEINKIKPIKTLDFLEEEKTKICYKKAKIIDTVLWVEGRKINRKTK